MKTGVAIAVLIGVLAFVVASNASTEARGLGILFLRTAAHSEGVQQIFDWVPGKAPRRVGPSSDWILNEQWSPDGTSIAFADMRGGWGDPDDTEIYTVDANGTHLRRVAVDVNRSNVFRDSQPSWSPGGRKIVYVRETENAPYEQLVVIDVRTGHERPLHVSAWNPAWGPAGIVYWGGNGEVMIVKPGRRPKVFTHAASSRFSWSAHGQLAGLERGAVVIFSGSGHELRRIAEPFERKTQVCGLAWSPDGTRILVRTTKKQVGLWTVTIADGNWRRLPVTLHSDFVGCAVSWH